MPDNYKEVNSMCSMAGLQFCFLDFLLSRQNKTYFSTYVAMLYPLHRKNAEYKDYYTSQ